MCCYVRFSLISAAFTKCLQHTILLNSAEVLLSANVKWRGFDNSFQTRFQWSWSVTRRRSYCQRWTKASFFCQKTCLLLSFLLLSETGFHWPAITRCTSSSIEGQLRQWQRQLDDCIRRSRMRTDFSMWRTHHKRRLAAAAAAASQSNWLSVVMCVCLSGAVLACASISLVQCCLLAAVCLCLCVLQCCRIQNDWQIYNLLFVTYLLAQRSVWDLVASAFIHWLHIIELSASLYCLYSVSVCCSHVHSAELCESIRCWCAASLQTDQTLWWPFVLIMTSTWYNSSSIYTLSPQYQSLSLC